MLVYRILFLEAFIAAVLACLLALSALVMPLSGKEIIALAVLVLIALLVGGYTLPKLMAERHTLRPV